MVFLKTFLNEIYQLLHLIAKYKEILSYRAHYNLAWELGRIDQQILNYNLLHSIGMESELSTVILNMTTFCLDINSNKMKNNEAMKIHQLYTDNILGYEYFVLHP